MKFSKLFECSQNLFPVELKGRDWWGTHHTNKEQNFIQVYRKPESKRLVDTDRHRLQDNITREATYI
jgi:hypothetical protein